MQYCDDAYAAMLLTLALSPDREEYARPLSTQEFRRLDAGLRACDLPGPGRLLGMDISGLMQLLRIPEDEALRLFTLLNRSVQLTYALESFLQEGIELLTQYDERYPRRLVQRLGETAPPVFYVAGNVDLLQAPLLAICGISGVKTSPVVRSSVRQLVEQADRLDYAVATGGELGVANLALSQIAEGKGRAVNILGGNLREHVRTPAFKALNAEGRVLDVSLEHPDALFTVSHAAARNQVLFALSEVAFIFNTDGKRAESEALRDRICDFIYAWDGHPANQALIVKGAVPFPSAEVLDFDELKRRWLSSRSEQLSLFDMLGEEQ